MRNDVYKYNTVGVGQVTLWNYQAEFPRYERHQLAQVYEYAPENTIALSFKRIGSRYM